MLKQKYNWIEKCWQVRPIKAISECCGLCCSVGQPDLWTPYSNANPDLKRLVIPDPGAV